MNKQEKLNETMMNNMAACSTPIDPIELIRTGSRDAREWAQAFVDSNHLEDMDNKDLDIMTSWFASAMMTMHDSMRSNEMGLAEDKVKKLKALMLLTDPCVELVMVGTTTIAQHEAFLDAFPDERELLELDHCKPGFPVNGITSA